MGTPKMSEKEALNYIATSDPDMPVFKKAVIALTRADSTKTRTIAWMSFAVSVISLLLSVVALVLKTR